MKKETTFIESCWRNWYSQYRKTKGKCDSWEKFWDRRQAALERYLSY